MNRVENRRRPRLETRQPASAVVMGMTVACEIRNFCRRGLYLAFADLARADRVGAGWGSGALVKVLFTAVVGGKPRMFRFFGTVAHASTAGVGLMVPSMPQEAFEALQAAERSRPVEPLLEHDDGSPDGPRRRCATLFKACLQHTLNELFDGLEAAFHQAADKASEMPERMRLREAPHVLTAWRAGIESRFLAQAVHHLAFHPQEALARGDDAQGLALLDEAEFEDWLRVAAVVNRLESEGDFAEPMVRVERRYGRLIGRSLDRQSNPFGPTAICQAFRAASGEVPLCSASRTVMHQAFGRALERHLPALVRHLDETLSVLGDPPPDRRSRTPGVAQAPLEAKPH
jgi:hypothetical protein